MQPLYYHEASSAVQPQQYRAFAAAQQGIERSHIGIGYSRAAPAFGRAVGIHFLVRDGIPAMQHDLPGERIAVGGFQTVQQVIDVDSPFAIAPLTHFIFAQRRAMAVGTVAEYRPFPAPVFAPGTGAAAMTYQAGHDKGILTKIPNDQACLTGMNIHIGQQADTGIHAFPGTKRLCQAGLLPEMLHIDVPERRLKPGRICRLTGCAGAATDIKGQKQQYQAIEDTGKHRGQE